MNRNAMLIVDDEPAVRRIHRKWLTDAGYGCVEAETVSEALEALQREPIGVALLDLRLPSGSGLVLAHQIHEHYPATAVVMVSAVAEFSTATEAMRGGAIDYLAKPVLPDALLKAVVHAAQRRRASAAAPAHGAAPSVPTSPQPHMTPAPAAGVPGEDHSTVVAEPAIDRLFRATRRSRSSS